MNRVKKVLVSYLKSTHATSVELMNRKEVKEALRCGNGQADKYLADLEPIRSGRSTWYLVDDVAMAVERMEAR